ncbi:MAG TPA: hypothetical protein ENJ09_08050 [Planctomycetes bacterium]|nr:hypothetical protein [Planctomycetota bacterium]
MAFRSHGPAGAGVIAVAHPGAAIRSIEDFGRLVAEKRRDCDVALLVLGDERVPAEALVRRAGELLEELGGDPPIGWLEDGRLAILLPPVGPSTWDLSGLLGRAEVQAGLFQSGMKTALEIRPRRPALQEGGRGFWSMPRPW